MKPSARVAFVDTSVVLNLLNVPGRNENHSQVQREFSDYRNTTIMVLPVTVVIETGNHSAHVPNDHERREAAKAFDRW